MSSLDGERALASLIKALMLLDEGLILTTSFNFFTSLKAIQSQEGLGLQHRDFGGHDSVQSTP